MGITYVYMYMRECVCVSMRAHAHVYIYTSVHGFVSWETREVTLLRKMQHTADSSPCLPPSTSSPGVSHHGSNALTAPLPSSFSLSLKSSAPTRADQRRWSRPVTVWCWLAVHDGCLAPWMGERRRGGTTSAMPHQTETPALPAGGEEKYRRGKRRRRWCWWWLQLIPCLAQRHRRHRLRLMASCRPHGGPH